MAGRSSEPFRKAAVSLADERLAMAKFPKPDDTRDIAAGEILALTLAKQAGIQVAEHSCVTPEPAVPDDV